MEQPDPMRIRNRFDVPIEQWETIGRLLQAHLAHAASIYSQIQCDGWESDQTEIHEFDQLLGSVAEDMLQHVILVADLIVMASGGNSLPTERRVQKRYTGPPCQIQVV
jgi:hypothetical protein